MELTISIVGADGTVKARASGTEEAKLVYAAAYEEGDVICLDGASRDMWRQSWRTAWTRCWAGCPGSSA